SLRLDALQRLALAKGETGAMESAIDAARRITILDPLREEAHRLLMRLLAAAGNRSAALKQYERCTQTLLDELGITTDTATNQLPEPIRPGRSVALQPGEPVADKGRSSPVLPAGSAGLPLPDKPSIVVLPFANLSGDASQDYFVDGLVE